MIDDVLGGTREAFLDEGVDEQVATELRMLWEAKLNATKAVDGDNFTTNPSHSASNSNGKSKGQFGYKIIAIRPIAN